MCTDMKKFVMSLLENYTAHERKIAVLRYELEHPAKVGKAEQIEAMNFGHGESAGHTKGHISNKTLYIALNYEEQAERINAETVDEIAGELFELERQQKKLMHYVGLLEKREAEVIHLVFMEDVPTKDVARRYGLTYRTIDRIKRNAVEHLAEMYAYAERFQG